MSMNAILIIFFISYGLYSFFNNFKFWLIYMLSIIIYYFISKKKFSTNNNKENIPKKINYTSWSNPYDPQTYTTLRLDITKILLTSKKRRRNKSAVNSNNIYNKIDVNCLKKIS